jgi:hypothetical protein
MRASAAKTKGNDMIKSKPRSAEHSKDSARISLLHACQAYRTLTLQRA